MNKLQRYTIQLVVVVVLTLAAASAIDGLGLDWHIVLLALIIGNRFDM